MTDPTKPEPTRPERPAGRRVLPHGRNPKAIGRFALVLLLVPVLLTCLALPLVQRRRSAMAADVPPRPASIDGDRAYRYLRQLCALGPRPAGSEANAKQRQLVASHFKMCGAAVREQPFRAVDPRTGARVQPANLIGSWHPERADRVLICAHYDTRPHPDQEVDPRRYRLPFVGANDGGSGVALLMEIAHHLNDLPTPWGVDLVLLDAEELVYGNTSDFSQYFLGAREFARAYEHGRRTGQVTSRYVAGILLDMVGGRDLQIEREPYSLKLAPWLVNEMWTVAEQLGGRAFSREVGREVLDDHLPLNNGGIPTIDLIDFDYPHWHLASDTPEQCSGASLAEVGRVVTAWLTLTRRSR